MAMPLSSFDTSIFTSSGSLRRHDFVAVTDTSPPLAGSAWMAPFTFLIHSVCPGLSAPDHSKSGCDDVVRSSELCERLLELECSCMSLANAGAVSASAAMVAMRMGCHAEAAVLGFMSFLLVGLVFVGLIVARFVTLLALHGADALERVHLERGLHLGQVAKVQELHALVQQDVAAERFELQVGAAAAQDEREVPVAFQLVQLDVAIRVEVAVERGHRDRGVRLVGHDDLDVAAVRLEVVLPAVLDRAHEGQVTAHAARVDLVGFDAVQRHVAVHGFGVDVADDVLEGDALVDGADLHPAAGLLQHDAALHAAERDGPRAADDLDLALHGLDADAALRALDL